MMLMINYDVIIIIFFINNFSFYFIITDFGILCMVLKA